MKIYVTGGSLLDSRRASEFTQQHGTCLNIEHLEACRYFYCMITLESLYCTVGCHPTRCGEFEEHPGGVDGYLDSLLSLSRENISKVVAIGECGLGIYVISN